jgi:hypothetical protein
LTTCQVAMGNLRCPLGFDLGVGSFRLGHFTCLDDRALEVQPPERSDRPQNSSPPRSIPPHPQNQEQVVYRAIHLCGQLLISWAVGSPSSDSAFSWAQARKSEFSVKPDSDSVGSESSSQTRAQPGQIKSPRQSGQLWTSMNRQR